MRFVSKMKFSVADILQGKDLSKAQSKAFRIFICTLIVLNILAVMFESVSSIRQRFEGLFEFFEAISVAVFTIEYLLRIWTVGAEGSAVRRERIQFAFSPMGIVDLLAILPFYLPLLFSVDLRFLRAIRLFRLVRLLKLGRYSKSMRILSEVLKNKAPDLAATAFIVTILLVLSSSGMYFFEREAQPGAFSSIPATMWWAVATLTTVGYGDIYPITVGGKLFGSFVAVLGVGMVALPAGILASGLIELLAPKRSIACPKCKYIIDGDTLGGDEAA